MNHDGENELPGTGSDPTVSAEYQAMANERTPPNLDSAVLKEAEASVRGSGLQGFTALWFRPLAFVASLALALALLLENTSTDTLLWTLDPETPTLVPSDNANTTTEAEKISSEFSEMIEASSKRMREQEAARDAIILNLNEPGAPQNFSSENFTLPSVPNRVTTNSPRSCTEELTVGPWAWWQCISDLDDAGRHDEARVEMEFFIKAYPDFPEL